MGSGDSTEYSRDKILESIQVIFNLTARVDERVQLLMQQQEDLKRRIEALNEIGVRIRVLEEEMKEGVFGEIKEIKDKLHHLEMKTQKIENSTEGQENRWKSIFGFALQLVWVLLAAWLLYKLGIQAPAVP